MLHLQRLPEEILTIILYYATNVPEALDTSYEFIAQENRDKVLQLVDNSMHTKLALSIVCKRFHAIMADFLYNIIILRSFKPIPRLFQLLRLTPPGSSLPRGHTCLRLDLYLGSNFDSYYDDEAWDEGVHVLWGLLFACSRLEILMLNIGRHRASRIRYCHIFGPTARSMATAALWKMISTGCGSSLRRLEILGIQIRMDKLELMLRYMENIEVCTISDINEFIDEYGGPNQLEYRDSADKYGEDDEDNHYEFEDSKDSFWFDKQTWAEFINARQEAVWPPYASDGPPYLLANLHTMFLGMMTERFFEFQLPSLRTLALYSFCDPDDVIFDTSLMREHAGINSSRSLAASKSHYPGWYKIDFASSEDGQYFRNPVPHSTPFGVFPTTITQLYMPYSYSLARILYFFPNLKHLAWVDYAAESQDPLPFYEQHEALCKISFFFYRHIHRECREALSQMLDAVRDGWWLIHLHTINIFDGDEGSYLSAADMDPKAAIDDIILISKECERLGIDLRIRTRNLSLMANISPHTYHGCS
ncbi:hypothetical protein H0H92_013592 [Tricholoma furcatifolium]|nr:hypothetical protein H0H92_013592 [Tricholoma furcatifolium]